LKSQPHLKGVVDGLVVYGSVVVVLNIGKTLISCAGVIGIVHAKDMHDHSVDNLGLAILMGVEVIGFVELGVQQ
jgi:hypothetical protein